VQGDIEPTKDEWDRARRACAHVQLLGSTEATCHNCRAIAYALGEYRREMERREPGGDGTERLGRAVYGRSPRPREIVGGSEAHLLHDAADEIERLRRRKHLAVQSLAREMMHTHKLECEGAFSLDRDPLDLLPAIDAYAAEDISGGKMRECIRRWLAGADFREPEQREWEHVNPLAEGDDDAD